MKLLVDMNLSPQWVDFLQDSGWETKHWSSVGDVTSSDASIMAYAAKNNFVVITHDLDFSAILAATHGEKPSVIQVRSAVISVGTIGKRIVAALRLAEYELEIGALVTIDPNRTRVRLLPLVR
jgi:predicted nuclease of predicted toxin-antitoxin system